MEMDRVPVCAGLEVDDPGGGKAGFGEVLMERLGVVEGAGGDFGGWWGGGHFWGGGGGVESLVYISVYQCV